MRFKRASRCFYLSLKIDDALHGGANLILGRSWTRHGRLFTNILPHFDLSSLLYNFVNIVNETTLGMSKPQVDDIWVQALLLEF